MAGRASPIREVAERIFQELDQTGIDRARAVEAVQRVAGCAQHEIVSNGGVGSADEVAAMLISAAQLMIGFGRNCDKVPWEQLTAELKRVAGPSLRVVKG